jgi:hypothetical protein
MKMAINKEWMHQFVIRSFINGIPIYFALSLAGDFAATKNYQVPAAIGIFMAGCLIWWLLAGTYCFTSILASRHIRENIFSWLFGFKERDEREEQIMAKSAKSSFLLIAGIVFIFFFISTVRVGFQNSSTGGYHGEFTVGHIKMIGESVGSHQYVADNGDAVNYLLHSFPLSTTGTLLALLFIQFTAFRYFSRRYNKDF